MIRSANIIPEYIRRFDSDFTQYFIIEFDGYIFRAKYLFWGLLNKDNIDKSISQLIF